MNSRFTTPDAPGHSLDRPAVTAAVAMITASYGPDFERCRLLCETMDAHVEGMSHHYLLVEHSDVALFRQLESAHRTVIDERDLLPRWLHSFRDPTSWFKRRVWLSTRTMPLRGWHVQQLRRIAISQKLREEVLVYCDSDVVFLKAFDCGVFWNDGDVRLFRRDNELSAGPQTDQMTWSRNAGTALGIAEPAMSPHDYIATLIAWRRETVQAMCSHMESLHGKHWVEVIASVRMFSECMIYGRYVDEILNGAGHFHGNRELCRVHWTGTALTDEEFRAFVDGMSSDQVAIGMQSFIGTDLGRIRRLLSLR